MSSQRAPAAELGTEDGRTPRAAGGSRRITVGVPHARIAANG
ncbi:hypothetical protein ACH4KN_32690 [Streptomyces sp. NPDC017546]|nr:hypothetical protein [Streptomyces sp. MMBL 11-1]